jgi:hypothetical protein
MTELDKWGNDANCHHPDTGCGCDWNGEASITLTNDDANALIEFLSSDDGSIEDEVLDRLINKLKELTETP